ncbi:MAG: glycine cleavage system aminomethyltransferase GcvT [Verrucomicrobiae bacterium]
MKTPLFDAHLAAGGRMVDFSGWQMPVQYSGILDEHMAVRESAGVFDISHMGEFFVGGPGCVAWLDSLLTNNVAALEPGCAHYSLMLNERGGVIDDLIVYRLGPERFLLVVNASMIVEDAGWMKVRLGEGVTFENRSAGYAALAVQGPDSGKIFAEMFGRAMPESRNRVLEIGEGFVVTTGYTGESGFEWIVPAAGAAESWRKVLAAGAKPCGLGARDTLRLEMCYPLNGSDLSPAHTPLEAGLGFFVDFSKPDFVGKAALVAQKASGIPRRLCAIKAAEKSPPIRSHYPVFLAGTQVGETTSGAHSPSLGCGIAMAYLPAEFAKPGQEVAIEIRGKKFCACVHKKPLYQKST